MNTMDLHEEFIKYLKAKTPKQTDIISKIAGILKIERDAAYRRLSGKVNFSLREAGIIARKLNISLDSLFHQCDNKVWLPFILEQPMKSHSMDSLYTLIEMSVAQMDDIATGTNPISGNIYNTLPMEFFLFSPVLTKLMFFKWGYYFIGTEEYDNFANWELPAKIIEFTTKLNTFRFRKNYYIWDKSLIWNLCNEIYNFHKMNIISTEDIKIIGNELKALLRKIEMILNNTLDPTYPLTSETNFYVSSIHLGFMANYLQSGEKHSAMFHTNFSFSLIQDDIESFEKLKKWMDSFRNISTLLSKSGRVERKIFFDSQYQIIDQILKL